MQISIKELAFKLKSSIKTINSHFAHNRKGLQVRKVDTAYAYRSKQSELSELLRRRNVLECSLILDKILTGDQKWVLYLNVMRQLEWRDRNDRGLSVMILLTKFSLFCF